MIETHPLGDFVPANAKYLLLGSFMAKKPGEGHYDWYYGSKRNQFWLIIEAVYNVNLPDKASRAELFTKLRIAISDIILACERRDNNSLDANLINIVYNIDGIKSILTQNKIEKIFFTSRFVEKEFRKVFKDLIAQLPQIELVTLPSPSPRYAKLSLLEKIEKYREVLPETNFGELTTNPHLCRPSKY